MIRFACKQCGQRHQRPDEAAGSLIFCECGQANRVPWESTGAWPEEAEEAEEAPQPSRGPSDEDKNDRLPQRSRSAAAGRRPQRPRHPGRCLDHQDCEAQHRCRACGEEFCSRCVVSFQGHMLCGPCKDHDMSPPAAAGSGVAAGPGCFYSGPDQHPACLLPYHFPDG